VFDHSTPALSERLRRGFLESDCMNQPIQHKCHQNIVTYLFCWDVARQPYHIKIASCAVCGKFIPTVRRNPGWRDCAPHSRWFVQFPDKKTVTFEHWYAAVAFAVYVYRNPHVMESL
jgi:hypothetical protein